METGAVTYLDTHAAVWLYAGELARFPASALEKIEKSALLISPMVLFEIELLREIRRITAGPDEILTALGRDLGLKVCTVPFAEVARAAIRENWTRDPFDRIIVSQARAADGGLISKDRHIRSAFAGTIWGPKTGRSRS